MKLSELINEIENSLKDGGVGKCKIGNFETPQEKEDGISHIKIVNHEKYTVCLDILPSIRMSVYLNRDKLVKLGFVDDFDGAPIPKFSELIQAVRSLDLSRSRKDVEFIGDFAVYPDNLKYCINIDKNKCFCLSIDTGHSIYEFIENVKKSKSKLEDLGFIDDLEAPKESVKDGEVHTPSTKTMKIKCLNSNCGYEIVVARSNSVVPYNNNVYKCPLCDSAMSKPFDYSKEYQESDVGTNLKPYKESTTPYSAVNHPKHYTQGKIECIDAIDSATINKSGIEAVCTANVIKYLWRYESKNGIEDVKKAQWYLQRLIKELEKNNKEKL